MDFGSTVWRCVQENSGNEVSPTIEDFFKRRISDEELLPRLARIRSLTEEAIRKGVTMEAEVAGEPV